MIVYDRHIFDVIDNEEKAYWVGFIMADGYLNENRRMTRIKLGEKDKNHLIKFIHFIGGNEDMLKYELHNTTHNKVYYVTLYSKEIKDALVNLGVRQGKSGKEKVANILPQYYKYFIRGMWDGDGFIRKDLDGIGIVGSYEMLSFIQNFFFTELNINPLKICTHGKIFKIEYRSQEAISKITHYLYDDASIYLDRKKQLVNQIEKIC